MKIPNLDAIKDWLLSKIINNMMVTEPGFFMDARQGPVIQGEIDEVNNRLSEVTSKLGKLFLDYNNIENISQNTPLQKCGLAVARCNGYAGSYMGILVNRVLVMSSINHDGTYGMCVNAFVSKGDTVSVDVYGGNKITDLRLIPFK